GMWLNGESRSHAEELVPDIAPLLKKVEKPHQRLHQSAVKIDEVFKQADPGLPALLTEIKVEHLQMVGKIRDAILKGESTVYIQTDSNSCGLGKWMNSEQGKKTYERASDEFKTIWNMLVPKHNKLHITAAKVEGRLGTSLESALTVFEEEMLPTFKATMNALDTLKKIAQQEIEGMNKAQQIYVTETTPALHSIQKLLTDIRAEAKEQILSNEAMLDKASSTKRNVAVVTAVCIALGLLLAVLMARIIAGPIMGAVGFAEKLSDGDFTQDLDIDQQDEIGVLAGSLNNMKSNLNQIFKDITSGIETLSSS
ncbi:MAG: HAMP domain-containing protein, partial [bacterium]|nr:HAMP domain-containing protein [bacterium]